MRFRVPKAPDKLLAMTDEKQAAKPAEKDVKSRSRPVKPGHLEIGEFTAGIMGGPSPFGKSNFPLPLKAIHYEHSEPVPERVLDDERH